MSPSHTEYRLKRDQQLRNSVDVGFDAPLMTSDTRLRIPDRKSINLRWFAGTVLTGITSVVLMGGALFAAIDSSYEIASPTSVISGSLLQGGRSITQPLQDIGSGSGKGDRFRPVVKEKPARRVIQVSTVAREGDRDFIRVKPFVYIKSPLALTTTDLIKDIPKFNPLAVYTEDQPSARQGALPTITSAKVDGEISIQLRDFPLAMGAVDVSLQTGDEEALDDIYEIGRFLNGEDASFFALNNNGPDGINFPAVQTLANELIGGLEPADPFSITIVPENVSFIERFDDDDSTYSYEELIVEVAKGDTLSKTLSKHRATKDEITSAGDAFIKAHAITQLEVGQKIRIAIATAEDGSDRTRPVRISLYKAGRHLGSVALNDDGQFVGAAEPYLEADLGSDEEQRTIPGQLPTIYKSLYQTGLSLEMPKVLVTDLIRIFTYDLDFQKRITPNDTLIVLHSTPDEGSKEAGNVLYTEVKIAGNSKQYYRYRTPDDGYVDYYDSSGRSAKKFLMRKPVASGRFRSPFGMRKHPITGVYKLHGGVDWATRRGTPIYAAGDGTIVKAKWHGGYGRHVRIQHANRYETSYSHMSKFGPGIKSGVRVRQGQLIGYVGSTGFSTGPHLHYEVLVNKRRVNPMKIKLPRGRVLKGEMLAKFHEERQRINLLIAEDENTKVASTIGN
ncbi:MAG: M23 family metallopeptidase [Rhodobacteraceae bacterium]|nr:M23 family metallopeptidase [Paracoccaceae bacterium]